MTRAPDLQRRRRIRRMLYLARVVGAAPDHDAWVPRFQATAFRGPSVGMVGAGLPGDHVRD